MVYNEDGEIYPESYHPVSPWDEDMGTEARRAILVLSVVSFILAVGSSVVQWFIAQRIRDWRYLLDEDE